MTRSQTNKTQRFYDVLAETQNESFRSESKNQTRKPVNTTVFTMFQQRCNEQQEHKTLTNIALFKKTPQNSRFSRFRQQKTQQEQHTLRGGKRGSFLVVVVVVAAAAAVVRLLVLLLLLTLSVKIAIVLASLLTRSCLRRRC